MKILKKLFFSAGFLAAIMTATPMYAQPIQSGKLDFDWLLTPEKSQAYVRKSADVQEALYKATGLTPEDHMSADGLFTIERVACLGACGLAPVCTVNGVVHPSMTPEKARKLIADIKEAEGV